GEEIAPLGEQALLHEVLEAARGEGRAPVLLGVRQLLAEPGHGAIEMMQLEVRHAGDAVVLAPALGRPVGAAAHEAMQHRQEHRALSANPCLRAPASSPITARQPVSSHSRSNTSAGPMCRTVAVSAASSWIAPSTIAFSANRAPERNSRSNCPLA